MTRSTFTQLIVTAYSLRWRYPIPISTLSLNYSTDCACLSLTACLYFTAGLSHNMPLSRRLPLFPRLRLVRIKVAYLPTPHENLLNLFILRTIIINLAPFLNLGYNFTSVLTICRGDN